MARPFGVLSVELNGLHLPSFMVASQDSVITIGRVGSCDIVVRDPSVARMHARLEFRGDSWWVLDCGVSSSGSFLEVGEQRLKVAPAAVFPPGATLHLGTAKIAWQSQEAEGGEGSKVSSGFRMTGHFSCLMSTFSSPRRVTWRTSLCKAAPVLQKLKTSLKK